MITTTEYGKQIILIALGYAKGWREQHCVEDDEDCFKYLFANDYSQVIGQPWCAFFATMVINQAANMLGLDCPIPFGGYSHNVVVYAQKNGIRVDNTPSIGSLFWYATDTGGHTGVIAWMDDKGIITVEGNAGNNLTCVECPKDLKSVVVLGNNSNRSYKALANKGVVFIHIEELGNTASVNIDDIFKMPISSGQQKEQELNAGMNPFGILLLLSALAGGVYYANKG